MLGTGEVVRGGGVSFQVRGYPSTTAGVANNFTVTAKDAFNNTALGYVGTVHFTSSDGIAVLPSDYTFTSGDAGVKTFSATLKTSGSQSITPTDTLKPSLNGTQSGTSVTSATVTKIEFTTTPPHPAAG